MNEFDIKTFRTARKWSQSVLAQKLGVNIATVWRWENEAPPKRKYVFKLLEQVAAEHPVTEPAE